MANDLSAFNAQAWSKRLVTKLDQINVMLSLINKDYEGELQNIGDTIQIRTPGNITMATYTKGQAISYQDLAPTKEPFTISTGQYFAFNVDDIDRAQTDLDAMDMYTKRAVVSMSNAVDAMILSQYTKVLAANKVTGAAGAAIVLDSGTSTATGIYQQFVNARTLLSKQNVPLGERWAIVGPDEVALLLEDTAHFVRSTEFGDVVVTDGTLGIRTADGTVRPGWAGRCCGFDVYEINTLPTTTSGTTPNQITARYLLFGDRDLITYAAQITEMEALRLQTTFANAIRGLLLHGATILSGNAPRGVTIKAFASQQ
jgi:hypothetical protein